MTTPQRRSELLREYDENAAHARAILEQVVEPERLEGCLADARVRFEAMIDEMPYADRPDHSMAGFSTPTYRLLALYLAARELGHDAHAVGRAIHAAPLPPRGSGGDPERMANLPRDAEASQRGAAPGDFVFRVVAGDGADSDYGVDILACSVCHAFDRHGASDLVPYMCAFDDRLSEGPSQALRRTGTIALGASHCDFRFKIGGEPRPLAPRHPDRIRLESPES